VVQGFRFGLCSCAALQDTAMLQVDLVGSKVNQPEKAESGRIAYTHTKNIQKQLYFSKGYEQ
jgi:hypothetical protein